MGSFITRQLKFALCSLVFMGFVGLGVLQAQTISTEVVRVSGVEFSRFSIVIKPMESFRRHREARNWLKLVEKNLCWSGIYIITNPTNGFCRASAKSSDMQIQLSLKEDSNAVLVMTIADKDNTGLFDQEIPLVKDNFKEKELMNAINQMTEKLTTEPGVLGTTIAFAIKQPGRKKVIARIDTHGNNIAALSHNQAISLLPIWAPKGDAIVYTTVSHQGTSVIYDDLKGGNSVLASYIGVNSGGTFFEDGKRLIITMSKDGNADLYSLNLKDRKPERITVHPAIDTAPSLSPDGKSLLFVSDRGGNEQIYTMNLKSQEIFRLTFDGIRNTDPHWSPNGAFVAFTKTVAGKDQIYMMDSVGENVHALTSGPYHSEQPSWSPDGKQLVFSSNRTGDFKLYIVFIDGTGLRRLTNTPKGFDESSPTWTLRQF